MSKIIYPLVLILSLSIEASSQNLSSNELENLMQKDISVTHDYLANKGYEYLGGDTSEFFKDTKVLKFGKSLPYKINLIVVFSMDGNRLLMLGYYCNAKEMLGKKQYFINKGFTLTNSIVTNEAAKYSYDKKNSTFSLSFGSQFKKQGNYTNSIVQLIRK